MSLLTPGVRQHHSQAWWLVLTVTLKDSPLSKACPGFFTRWSWAPQSVEQTCKAS